MADETKKEPTHTLVEFSQEEAEEVSKGLQEVLAKHDGMFHIRRIIDDAGTFQAVLQVLKKVPIVPKEDGVVSPIQAEDLKDDGRNNKEETGETADAPAA